MSQEMRELAEKFTAQLSSINEEEQREFINELTDAITEPKKKIPEPVFREIFLPFFTGEKVPSQEEDAIAHWIGLVGSASNSADVVDVKGNVLFEVPPVYDTDKINIVKDDTDNTNMGTIFSIYAEQSIVHTALGNKFLGEELAKKTKYIDSGKDTGHSWEPALRYYGIIKEEEVKKLNSVSNGDDDLEFEDD